MQLSSRYKVGSKQELGVVAAAIMDNVIKKVSLPSAASIFTAELIAISLSLDIVEKTTHSQYVIATDSLSSVTSIKNKSETNHLIQRGKQKFLNRISNRKEIVVTWVPSHVGIRGNERVDQVSKEVARRESKFIPIPFKDSYPLIRKRAYELWTEEWQTEMRALKEIELKPEQWSPMRVHTQDDMR